MSGENELMSYLKSFLADNLKCNFENGHLETNLSQESTSFDACKSLQVESDIVPTSQSHSSDREADTMKMEGMGSNQTQPPGHCHTHEQLEMVLRSPRYAALLETRELINNLTIQEDTANIVAEVCDDQDKLQQVIDSLHRDVENICSLIMQLRSIMSNKFSNTHKEHYTVEQNISNNGGLSFGSETQLLSKNEVISNSAVREANDAFNGSDFNDKIKGNLHEIKQPKEVEVPMKSKKEIPQKESNVTETPFFYCDFCSFKTVHLKNMNGHLVTQHKKIIPGVKTYNCHFCDYRCVDKQRIDEHEPIHTGIKTFICAECNKKFATKRGLRTHLHSHKTERPYKCDYCAASFKVRSKLNDHKKLLHTRKGEKPYQCGYCQHTASVRGNVNQHIKRLHKGKPVLVFPTEFKSGRKDKEQ